MKKAKMTKYKQKKTHKKIKKLVSLHNIYFGKTFSAALFQYANLNVMITSHVIFIFDKNANKLFA